MVRTSDMAFYFLFAFFLLLIFFAFGLDKHVIGRKLRGRVRVCSNYLSCMIVPAKWQMATFLGDPTK